MEKILFISPSTLDRKSLIFTLIFGVIPALFLGWLFYRCLGTNNTFLAVTFGSVIVLFGGIFISGVVITPYKYILTSSHLIIKRHIKDIVIPLHDVKVVRLMTPDDKKGMIRTFGAEGVFGSWGYFRSSAHNKLMVLARRYDNRTLIVTDRKKYVIAPNDTQLIEAIMQQTGNAPAADSLFMDAPTKHWLKFLPVAIIVPAFIFIFLSYKEPQVVFESNTFKMKGIYGVNIPLTEITEVDTIGWRNMPAISMRTNGISAFKVHRGHFKTVDGDKIRMSVHSGVNPVIRMVDRQGAVYYINRKNAAETRQIFNKLKK